MKGLLVLVCSVFVFINGVAFAQDKMDTLKESKHIPAFVFYTLKDSSVFTKDSLIKNTPLLFIYFNSECDHCQYETKQIVEYIKYFKGIQIVMVSREPQSAIIAFREKYHLDKLPITVLQDGANKMHDYFDFAYIPLIRQYDRKGNLIGAYSENAHILDLLGNFDEHR